MQYLVFCCLCNSTDCSDIRKQRDFQLFYASGYASHAHRDSRLAREGGGPPDVLCIHSSLIMRKVSLRLRRAYSIIKVYIVHFYNLWILRNIDAAINDDAQANPSGIWHISDGIFLHERLIKSLYVVLQSYDWCKPKTGVI